MLQSPVANIAPEVLSGPPAHQLLELRKSAVENGIPLSQIDEYLLGQDWVSVAVKRLIRASVPAFSGVAAPAAAEMAGVSVEKAGAHGPVVPAETAGVVVRPEGIKGTVKIEGVLDAKQQMDKIKKDFGTGEVGTAGQTIEAAGRPVEIAGSTVETDGLQEVKIQEQGIQTAEQKEQMTTDATQDTAAEVAKRFAMSIQGYVPSKTVIMNATNLAAQGDVKEAKTWQGALVQRIQEMWNNLKGLVLVQ